MGGKIGEIADGVNEHSASASVNKSWRSIHRINQQNGRGQKWDAQRMEEARQMRIWFI
jgi:hypothetical protein